MRKYILIIGIVILSSFSFASEEINVNINMGQITPRTRNKTTFGLGITNVFFGTVKEEIFLEESYIKSINGLNCVFGFTSRNYLGDGLKTQAGAVYFEFGTMAILVPFIGVGYDYRISENGIIGFGLPDLVHFSMTF